MKRALVAAVVALLSGPGAQISREAAVAASRLVFLHVHGGDLQVAALGQEAAKPLQVAVVDEAGRPVAGVDVIFHVVESPDGGGFAGGATSLVSRSNRDGIASARVFAPVSEGRIRRLEPLLVDFASFRANPGYSRRFRIQGVRAERLHGTGTPAYLLPLGGDCIRPNGMAGACPVGELDETLNDPVGVLVIDESFHLVPGWPVSFEAELGSFPGGQRTTVHSDDFGVARAEPYTIKGRYIPTPAYIGIGLTYPTSADLQRVWATTLVETAGTHIHLEAELGVYGYP